MTNPTSFSSLEASDQPVSIKSVDPANYVANAVTRQGSMLQVDLHYHVGAVHVIPVQGDQWMVRRMGMTWALLSQLPHNTTELLTVVDEPTEGLTQVGSSNPQGVGNLHLNGGIVVSNGALQLKNAPTGGMPDVGDRTGVLAYDDVLKVPVYFDGGSWNLLGEPEGGFSNTDDLPEGATNLYFTDTRAADAAPVQSVNGLDGAVVIAKVDIGLGNVDDTSDEDKPISIATAAALDDKADLISGVVPDGQLPPRDVKQYDEFADFPVVGDSAVLYIADDTGNLYRWNAGGASYDLMVSGSGTLSNTDELPEGTANLYFTNGRVTTQVNTMYGTASNTITQGNDSRLSNQRTPTDNSVTTVKIVDGNVTMAKLDEDVQEAIAASPYDVSYPQTLGQRAVGYGQNTIGVKLVRAVTFTEVTYRCGSADGSGSLMVELRKNGTAVSGTSASIFYTDQVAGTTVTGTWAFADGDILTVYITAVGSSGVGVGLVADLKGDA